MQIKQNYVNHVKIYPGAKSSAEYCHFFQFQRILTALKQNLKSPPIDFAWVLNQLFFNLVPGQKYGIFQLHKKLSYLLT